MSEGVVRIFAPLDADPKRVDEIAGPVKREAKSLGLPVEGPFPRDDDRICVFYEDDETKCYVYVDDYEKPVNTRKVSTVVRTMTAVNLGRKKRMVDIVSAT